MAIDKIHKCLEESLEAVELVRDCCKGGRAIKRKGTKYLPQLYEQNEAEYQAYVTRANFFNVTKRALSAFVGFVFRKNPEVESPKGDKGVDAFLQDATMTGKSWYDYCKKIVREVFSVGRSGTLVDWANPALENRAFLIRYDTEDIINWKYGRVNGKTVLVLLVLREWSNVFDSRTGDQPPDEYVDERYEQWRQYELKQDGDKNSYVVVSVWRKSDKAAGSKKQDYVKISEKNPNRMSQPLTRIPFIFHNVEGEDAEPDVQPLDDIAGLNVSHYHSSADLEGGLHICGSPTLVLTGFPEDGEYVLGAGHAIVTKKEGGKAEMLSADSQKMSGLSEQMTKKESQMAALGARMLEKQGTGGKSPEAFETVQIRQSGEVSALMDMTIYCSETLSRVLRLVAWWYDRGVEFPEDLEGKVFVELNTEYTSSTMDSATLTAYVNAYLQQTISYEVFFAAMQAGEIISSERTIEDEKAALQDSPITLPAEAEAKQAAAALKLAAQNKGKEKPAAGGAASA